MMLISGKGDKQLNNDFIVIVFFLKLIFNIYI